jgi:hypothetical protein
LGLSTADVRLPLCQIKGATKSLILDAMAKAALISSPSGCSASTGTLHLPNQRDPLDLLHGHRLSGEGDLTG